jgi:hypothetical protein
LPRRPLSGYHRWTQSNRLKAFSDGVLAIIITIMVLELKVPRGVDLAALAPMLPVAQPYMLCGLPRDPPAHAQDGASSSQQVFRYNTI